MDDNGGGGRRGWWPFRLPRSRRGRRRSAMVAAARSLDSDERRILMRLTTTALPMIWDASTFDFHPRAASDDSLSNGEIVDEWIRVVGGCGMEPVSALRCTTMFIHAHPDLCRTVADMVDDLNPLEDFSALIAADGTVPGHLLPAIGDGVDKGYARRIAIHVMHPMMGMPELVHMGDDVCTAAMFMDFGMGLKPFDRGVWGVDPMDGPLARLSMDTLDPVVGGTAALLDDSVMRMVTTDMLRDSLSPATHLFLRMYADSKALYFGPMVGATAESARAWSAFADIARSVASPDDLALFDGCCPPGDRGPGSVFSVFIDHGAGMVQRVLGVDSRSDLGPGGQMTAWMNPPQLDEGSPDYDDAMLFRRTNPMISRAIALTMAERSLDFAHALIALTVATFDFGSVSESTSMSTWSTGGPRIGSAHALEIMRTGSLPGFLVRTDLPCVDESRFDMSMDDLDWVLSTDFSTPLTDDEMRMMDDAVRSFLGHDRLGLAGPFADAVDLAGRNPITRMPVAIADPSSTDSGADGMTVDRGGHCAMAFVHAAVLTHDQSALRCASRVFDLYVMLRDRGDVDSFRHLPSVMDSIRMGLPDDFILEELASVPSPGYDGDKE